MPQGDWFIIGITEPENAGDGIGLCLAIERQIAAQLTPVEAVGERHTNTTRQFYLQQAGGMPFNSTARPLAGLDSLLASQQAQNRVVLALVSDRPLRAPRSPSSGTKFSTTR